MGLGRVGVGDELDRARARVPRRARQRDRLLAERLAQLRRDDRRRRLLEHLLVAPLQRALALAEREHVAVGVGDDLHLDVPRARQEALDEHAVVAEAGLGLALGGGDRLVELVGARDDAHPAPTAARRGLDQQRVGVRRRVPRRPTTTPRPARRPRGRRLGPHLVAHQLDRVRARPDEHHVLAARAGERRVLRQEPVARVHGVGAAPSDADDLLDRQIRRDAHRLVGLAHVRRTRVGVGVDGDAAHPEALQGPDHPPGDLPPVGHQHRLEHVTRPSARAMTICCTSSVPSPMVRIFASRYMRHTGYSSM